MGFMLQWRSLTAHNFSSTKRTNTANYMHGDSYISSALPITAVPFARAEASRPIRRKPRWLISAKVPRTGCVHAMVGAPGFNTASISWHFIHAPNRRLRAAAREIKMRSAHRGSSRQAWAMSRTPSAPIGLAPICAISISTINIYSGAAALFPRRCLWISRRRWHDH